VLYATGPIRQRVGAPLGYRLGSYRRDDRFIRWVRPRLIDLDDRCLICRSGRPNLLLVASWRTRITAAVRRLFSAQAP